MKLLKMLALSYLIKTLLVGIAWLFIPDLPSRAMSLVRSTWARFDVGASNVPAPAVAVPKSAP